MENKTHQFSDRCCAIYAQTGKYTHCPSCFALIKKNASETAIQVDVVNTVRAMFPNLVIVHVNNNQTNKAAGARAKAMGTLKGFPDLIIFASNGNKVLIEMKTQTGTVSKDQKKIHKQLSALGHPVVVCRSLIEVIELCRKIS